MHSDRKQVEICFKKDKSDIRFVKYRHNYDNNT
jgi:hypothetical protein